MVPEFGRWWVWPLCLTALLLSACTSSYEQWDERTTVDGATGEETLVLGRSERYVVVLAGRNDTFQSLASQFLDDESKFWAIADANGTAQVTPGQEVVIPLQSENPVGVYADGFDTVAILSYHRFGNGGGKLTVAPAEFRAQMAYLRDNDYRVVPLGDLPLFLRGERRLPRRSVVITIDDGYRSFYQIAYPILAEFGFPSTLFVYSDFIGNGGVTWADIEEMRASGLVSIQPHSKTHSNLALPARGEDARSYSERVRLEVAEPARRLRRRVNETAFGFAYPYGDANDEVVSALQRNDYSLGLTVHRGGNPAFAFPYMLRRTMVFGGRSLERFRHALEVFERSRLL